MCFFRYLLSFLCLINESKHIDNLPGEDGTRRISESSYKRISTVNNLQSNMLKQHWAPFCLLLGSISACWSPIYSKKRKLQYVRRWWHDSNKMLSLPCHFNGTFMVVLHVRLRPLCKWFSLQLLPWSGAFHFGISLLVAHFMQPAFFLFFESFHSFVVSLQLGIYVYSWGLGLGLCWGLSFGS